MYYSYTVAVVSNVSSSCNDGDSITVVIGGAVVGTLLVTVFTVIFIIMVYIMCRRRKQSKKIHKVDVTIEMSSGVLKHQQCLDNTSGQS